MASQSRITSKFEILQQFSYLQEELGRAGERGAEQAPPPPPFPRQANSASTTAFPPGRSQSYPVPNRTTAGESCYPPPPLPPRSLDASCTYPAPVPSRTNADRTSLPSLENPQQTNLQLTQQVCYIFTDSLNH